jgi:hypothetical protein
MNSIIERIVTATIAVLVAGTAAYIITMSVLIVIGRAL